MADGLELKNKTELPKAEQPEIQVDLASVNESRETIPVQVEKQEPAEKPQELPTRAPVVQQVVPQIQKDRFLIGIEHILSDNLGDAYLALPPDKRTAFKARGEEIATKVKEMADKGRLHVHKILHWIRDWLRMIPGVNVFFLEQEAKIKADKLLEYYKQHTGK